MRSPSPSAGNGKLLSHKTVLQVVLFGLLGALMVVLQVVMMGLPNIEPVSLLVILCTCAFGCKALWPTCILVLAEGLIYGFGNWWFSYTYIWAVLIFLSLPFRRQESPLLWAVISGLFGLFFGLLTTPVEWIIGGPAHALAYWIDGLKFDLLHCVGNFAIMLILFKPLRKVFRIAEKMIA